MWRSVRQRGTVEEEEDKERDLPMGLDENASDTGTRRRRMNHLLVATSPTLRRKLPEGPRRPGSWLLLARVVWVSIVVPTYALFVANVPAYFASLHLLARANADVVQVDRSARYTPARFRRR